MRTTTLGRETHGIVGVLAVLLSSASADAAVSPGPNRILTLLPPTPLSAPALMRSGTMLFLTWDHAPSIDIASDEIRGDGALVGRIPRLFVPISHVVATTMDRFGVERIRDARGFVSVVPASITSAPKPAGSLSRVEPGESPERIEGKNFLQKAGQARVRIRRNPGFALLTEYEGGECRQTVTYRLKVRKQAGQIVFSVDGRELARATDATPWSGGLLGLRTFGTRLWWDNVRVTPL